MCQIAGIKDCCATEAAMYQGRKTILTVAAMGLLYIKFLLVEKP